MHDPGLRRLPANDISSERAGLISPLQMRTCAVDCDKTSTTHNYNLIKRPIFALSLGDQKNPFALTLSDASRATPLRIELRIVGRTCNT